MQMQFQALLPCNHTDCNQNRDGDWYYTEIFHTDLNLDQDWKPEIHWDTIKHITLQLLQDQKNGYATFLLSSNSLTYIFCYIHKEVVAAKNVHTKRKRHFYANKSQNQ